MELPTKDKRFKLREYLVALRDAQKVAPATTEYTGAAAGAYTVPTSDQTPYLATSAQSTEPSSTQSSAFLFQAAQPAQEPYTTQTSSESFVAAASGDSQLDTLNQLCRQINANVLQLKLDFAEYAVGRGAGGCYDAVDMDLSDPGEDMELSDCDMSQEERGASDVNGLKSLT